MLEVSLRVAASDKGMGGWGKKIVRCAVCARDVSRGSGDRRKHRRSCACERVEIDQLCASKHVNHSGDQAWAVILSIYK